MKPRLFPRISVYCIASGTKGTYKDEFCRPRPRLQQLQKQPPFRNIVRKGKKGKGVGLA